jgi:dihydrofolate reductase
MRHIITITHLTLDGVMQSPGPGEDASGGFTQGGWSAAYRDEEKGQFIKEIMSHEFDMLLGRRTYENFARFWPNAGDNNPIAKAFNKATKYVATNTLDAFDWANTRRLSGTVVDAVRTLKASDGPDLHVWGSSELIQALNGADLIDEFRLMVYPVVVGTGKRLFGTAAPARALTLVQSIKTPKGILLNTYRSAGSIPKGS